MVRFFWSTLYTRRDRITENIHVQPECFSRPSAVRYCSITESAPLLDEDIHFTVFPIIYEVYSSTQTCSCA